MLCKKICVLGLYYLNMVCDDLYQKIAINNIIIIFIQSCNLVLLLTHTIGHISGGNCRCLY